MFDESNILQELRTLTESCKSISRSLTSLNCNLVELGTMESRSTIFREAMKSSSDGKLQQLLKYIKYYQWWIQLDLN